MLFSVLWLRTALAAGFVPNEQHGIFVVEKRHMLVWVLFFWPAKLQGNLRNLF